MTPSGKPLRVGLVGTGRIGATWIEALHASSTCELAAVVDIDLEAARRAADVPYFDSLEAAAETAVEALVIATPPKSHVALTLEACERGLHVLCEKPFATTSEDAHEMVRAAHRADVVLTMASKFRFVGDVQEAKRLLRSGAIGKLVLFENTFASPVDMRARWNSHADTSGGGVLMDNGTHSLDLFRYFAGEPSRLSAIVGPSLQGLDVEESVQLFLATDAGVHGDIELSWSLDKQGTDLLRLHGTEGQIHVGWQGSRLKTADGVREFGSGYDKIAAFGAQLNDFAGCVRHGTALTIDTDDAIGSVHAVESAYRALEQTRWTPVRPARPLAV